jgi:hypothetical protein
MLAAPRGAKALVEIEDSTKLGHGLYTVDGLGNGLEQIVVGVFSGFFPAWAASMGLPINAMPQKKARRYEDLSSYPETSWLSVETLFASIPEVSDLFSDIFEGKPRWAKPVPDQMANAGMPLFGTHKLATRSYVRLVDSTGRLTKEDVALFPGPLAEIAEVVPEGPGRHFRVAVDHPSKNELYIVLNTGRWRPHRQANLDLLMSVDNCGLLTAVNSKDLDGVVAAHGDQWLVDIKAGRIGSVLGSIDALPDAMNKYKGALKIQMFHQAGLLAQAVELIRAEVSSGRNLGPVNLEPSRPGAQNIIGQFPALKSRNVDDYIDEGILDSLKKEGFFAEIERKYAT